MAAKLLRSFADDNPDLQKQIGCMNGIFQIFDRHHVLTGRRISHHKRLPEGNSHFSNGGMEREYNNAYHRQTVAEMNLSKSVNERQRMSMESSRASFSSTCSSLSSLDYNKTAEPGTSSYDRTIFPETPLRGVLSDQSSTSPRLGRLSLDLRDVVKDSMHREARGLSVKTATKEEAAGRGVKHRDSPRPLQLSKSVEGSNGKQNVAADLKESLRVLAKIREAPWYGDEARERPRSSYEGIDSMWSTTSKDAPRHSYDGKERSRLSLDSRDTFRSTPKLKELPPRHSLDSREGSLRGYRSDSKSNHSSQCFQDSGNSNDRDLNLAQSSGTHNRPPSVVAKLMGLEALPDSSVTSTFLVKDIDPFPKPMKLNNLHRPMRISNTSRSSLKDPTSPRWKNPDLVMRPISSSKFPIEPAPWKTQDGSQGSQKPSSKPVKGQVRTPDSFPSVYSEIEKRLKDLEFKQSGKDLRALKQILEAMRAKGLLENKKEEQASNFGTQKDSESKFTSSNQNSRSVNQQSASKHGNSSTARGSASSRGFESSIVIMKPAKLVEKSGIPTSSLIPINGISDAHARGAIMDNKRGSTSSRTAKDQNLKKGGKYSAVSSTDKKASGRNMRSTQSQPKDNTGTNSIKNSGSVSPRLQQKKLELGKSSRPPTPPSDTRKSRRQSSKQLTETSSPVGKLRPKSSNLQQSDDQLSEISNESRTLSFQGDDLDMELNSIVGATEMNDSHSPSLKASKYLASGSMQQQKSSPRLEEDGSVAELATVAPEHPSPVSVLDASAYRDDAPSPVKQMRNALQAEGAEDSNHHSEGGDQWNPEDNLDSMGSGLNLEINRKKLKNIENLVQKLRRLNSNHDEARTDYIASLCENSNPDHRYISEILLASGLLLRDLGSSLTTFQLHPSGHPINPELFYVLEQTKASSLLANEESIPEKETHGKQEKEKSHRRLIFDAVNEILVDKLDLVLEPWLKTDKLAKNTLNAQKLLRELSSEIEQLEAKKLECDVEDEDDGLKTILCEDVMHRSESWTVFRGEMSGVVLDVERLIFKDLVDEIVIGEAASLRARPARRRNRQLFAK